MTFRRSGGCVSEAVFDFAELSDLWQHHAATGRPAGTLDGFLLPSEGHNLRAFLEAAGDADICILEGNGGLFDGTDGKSEDGSTAQVAKLLGAPVCLVLDPCQTGRSAAAMLKGYKAFDSQLRLEAILLSKAADDEHARRIESALEGAGVAVRVLGAIHKVRAQFLQRLLLYAAMSSSDIPQPSCGSHSNPENRSQKQRSLKAALTDDAGSHANRSAEIWARCEALIALSAFCIDSGAKNQRAITPGAVQDERRAVHGLQRATDDRRISDAVAQHLAHQLEENVDLDALVELASQACMPPVPEGHPAVSFEQEHRVRLAVARDAAFSMYYSEYVPNLACS